MKRTITSFLLLLLAFSALSAQVTVFTENFEGTTHQFTLNTTDMSSLSSGSNSWVVNNAYTGGSGSVICFGFPFTFTVPNTATQPSSIFNFPTSKYMHLNSSAASNAGILNSCFLAADGFCTAAENNFARMTSDVSTTGLTGVNFSFYWVNSGGPTYYGEVYYSTNSGTSWTKITSPISNYSGGSTWAQATLTNAAFDNKSTLRFGFRFVNSNGTTGSDPAFAIDDVKITGSTSGTITVTSLNPTTYCPGAAISIPFTVTGTINSGNVFTAQLSDANGNFGSPATLGTLNSVSSGTISGTIPPGTPAGTGYQIRVNASNPMLTGITYPVNITVNQGAVAGTASVSNDTICLGDTASFNLSGSAGAILWQYSLNGTSWVSLGVTSAAFDHAPTVLTYYRAQLTNPCGTVTSNVLTVVPITPNQVGTISASPGSVCAGGSTQISVGGVTGNITWEYSLNGTIWSPLAGSGSSVNSGPLTQTTYFRAVVSNGFCPSVISATQTVTVSPAAVAGVASASTDSVCEGDSVLITLTGSVGTLSWEHSTNNSNWSPVASGITSFYYQPGSPNSWLRAILGSSCGNDTTNVLHFVLVSANQGGTISASPDTICAGESATISISNSMGNIGWEISANGTAWSPIGGVGPSINTGPLTQTTWYRARLTNSICPTAFSGVVKVTVLPQAIASFSSSSNALSVIFNDNSVNANTWQWDFGDGNTSTTQNPTHNYSAGGTYTVVLIVSNNGYCPDTTSQTISLTGIGVDDPLATGIRIYPNPFTQTVQVNLELRSGGMLKIEVVDLMGRILVNAFEGEVPSGAFAQELYLADRLAIGTYLIRFNFQGKHFTQKLLKVE
ncbi:MAG: PKD domain-containing protein [Bacteroidia bacterium]|nr:PKD domain-containing protein [Bacteroidia bacterium]